MEKLKTSIGVLLVIFITFCFLVIPYKNISFDSDTLGFIYHFSQLKSLSGLMNSMSGKLEAAHASLNVELGKINALSYYRPLLHPFYYFLVKFFGTNPYPYFLLASLFHAIVAGMVFYIFLLFLDYIWAFLLALLFAFHPALTETMLGSTCMLTQIYVLVFIAIILYIKYIRTNNNKFYLLSSFFYLLALFFYEIPFALPGIPFLYFLLFDRSNLIKKTWLLFFVNLFYGVVRILLLGLPSGGKTLDLLPILSNFKSTLILWKLTLKSFLGMVAMPNFITALITLFLVVLVCLFLIYQSDQRKIMLFYIGSFIIASWAVVLGYGCQTRYLYMGIPFFVLILYELVTFVVKYIPVKSKSLFKGGILFILLLCSVIYASLSLRKLESYTHARDLAFIHLADKAPYYKGKKIIFLGNLVYSDYMIFPLGSGMTQAARFFLKDPNLLAYHVLEANFYSKNQPKDNFYIKPIKNGYRFISPNPELYNFICSHSLKEGDTKEFFMGIMYINKKFSVWQASDISFVFDQKWLNLAQSKEIIFLSWDMVKQQFIELNSRHLY